MCIKKNSFGFVEILTLFFSTLFVATARNASAPRRCGIPLSDNSREGNTTQSQKRRGGSEGGQALFPPITGYMHLLKSYGFNRASLPKIKSAISVQHSVYYSSKIFTGTGMMSGRLSVMR